MDPLGLLERLFGGRALPVWLLIPLTIAVLVIVLGTAVREINHGVQWYRSTARQSRLASAFEAVFSLKFLFRVVIIGWMAWISVSVWQLNEGMTRYVWPRRLTETQKASLAAVLREVKPHDIYMTLPEGDTEAHRFGADLKEAIEKGGWPVISTNSEPRLDSGIKLRIRWPSRQRKTSAELARERVRGQDPEPDDSLYRAFGEAGVPIGSQSSGIDANLTAPFLNLVVGPRSRD